MREFINQWKHFSFRVALNNSLVDFTKKFIGAKKITIIYIEDKDE